MPNVEHSFVLYALLLEPGGCLRAHITLFELVEPEEKKYGLSLRGSLKRSATIWASGRTRDPYFEILGAPRGIMVTPSGGFARCSTFGSRHGKA